MPRRLVDLYVCLAALLVVVPWFLFLEPPRESHDAVTDAEKGTPENATKSRVDAPRSISGPWVDSLHPAAMGFLPATETSTASLSSASTRCTSA